MNNLNDRGHVSGDYAEAIVPNVMQVQHGGPLHAGEINRSNAMLLDKQQKFENRVSEVESSLENFKATAIHSGEFNGALARYLKKQEKIQRAKTQADNLNGINTPATYKKDFSLLEGASYKIESTASPGSYNEFPLARRARFDPQYGIVTLPHLNSISLFRAKTAAGEPPVVLNADVEVSVSSDQTPAKKGHNSTEYIYDGRKDRQWVGYAKFPLDSNVTEVTWDITIQVPETAEKYANVLKLSALPQGHCDLTAVQYSASGATPSTDLISDFETITEFDDKQFVFEDTQLASIKISLRSRRWVEENGDKTFYVGIGDLDLQLVQYDETYGGVKSGLNKVQNTGFFDVIDIPKVDGVFNQTAYFDKINAVRVFPTASTSESSGTNNGIRVSIFSDSDLNTQVWDSISNASVPKTISSSVEKLYVVVELDPISDVITPVLEGYEIDYTVRV